MKQIAILATQSSEMTMTSVEIAKLTGKDHKNVLRDIRLMLEELEIDPLRFEQIEKFANNRERTVFALPQDECLTLVTGYDTKLRIAVVKRWRELEAAQRAPAPAPVSFSQRVLNDFDLFTDDLDQAHAQMFCMAKETQKLVAALSQRLAVGDFCTWTQLRSVNQHLDIMQSTNGAWIPAAVARAAKAQGIKLEELGTEGSGTQFRGKSYPTEWLVNTVEHLLKTECYPYVEVKLNVPLRKDIEPRLANKAMTQLELKAAKALGNDDNIN